MADKTINQLTQATALTDSSLFVIEQNSTAKQANWGMMKNYISPGVAAQYSTSATYNVGDYVIYNGQLYRCTTAITTPESWTAAHWTAAMLGKDVGDLKSDLTVITGNQSIAFSDPSLRQYINTNQNVGTVVSWSNPSQSSSTNIKWAVVECKGGDQFTINGQGGNADRLWAFLDASQKLISKSSSALTAVNLIVTAPEGAKYLIINDESDKKSYTGNLVVNKANEAITQIKESNVYNPLYNGSFVNTSFNGVTYTWDGKVCNITGSATQDSFSTNIFYANDTFPETLKAGDLLDVQIESTDQRIYLNLFFYNNNTQISEFTICRSASIMIPTTATGMLLRLKVFSGTNNINGAISFSITNKPTSETMSKNAPVVIPSTEVDCAPAINRYLAEFGKAQLVNGEYKIDTGITMPLGASLFGCGANCVLHTTNENLEMITLEGKNLIDGVTIRGASDHSDSPTAVYSGKGIVIKSTGDGETPRLYNIINNCRVYNFAHCGIQILRTGTYFANNANIRGCEIVGCRAGIYIDHFGEFNRISDCVIRENYYGIINDGGNNVFSNCGINGNKGIGFLISSSATNNEGHGELIGCTLNHTANNNGPAIVLYNNRNGFLFTGCHIWYGGIELYDQSGQIIFTGCQLGGTSNVIKGSNSNCIIFNGCGINNDPDVQGSISPRFINCFKKDGTIIT